MQRQMHWCKRTWHHHRRRHVTLLHSPSRFIACYRCNHRVNVRKSTCLVFNLCALSYTSDWCHTSHVNIDEVCMTLLPVKMTATCDTLYFIVTLCCFVLVCQAWKIVNAILPQTSNRNFYHYHDDYQGN